MAKEKKTEEQVQEAAPVSSNKKATVTAKIDFRDINDYSKEYKAGDKIEGFTAERIESLKKAGIIE